jgi:hypothetical protein
VNPLARRWDVSGTLAEKPFFAAAAESGAPMFGLIGRASVEARPGTKDRRQRQLFPTARGQALALEAAVLQSRRLARVFGERPEAPAQAIDFLLGMVDAGGRDKIAAMTGAGPAARPQR